MRLALPEFRIQNQSIRAVLWMFEDIARFAPTELVRIAVLSAIAVGGRVAGIGTIVVFVGAQTSVEPLQIMGYSPPTDTAFRTMILWGGTALLFGLIAAAASYRMDQIGFGVARAYVEGAIQKVIDRILGGEDFEPKADSDRPNAVSIRKLLGGDGFAMMRQVYLVVGMPLPVLTLIAATGVLVWLNAPLTLSLAPALGIYLYVLSRLNRNVARDAERHEELRAEMGRDVSSLNRSLKENRYPAGSVPEWITNYLDYPVFQGNVGAFRGILQARRRVDNLRDVFQGAALLLTLMVFGSMLGTPGVSWAAFLTYLAALRYSITSLSKASKIATGTSRYLPLIKRYHDFENQVTSEVITLTADDRARPLENLRIASSPSSLPGSLPEIILKPGEPALCLSDSEIGADNLSTLAETLFPASANSRMPFDRSVFYLGRRGTLPEFRLRELLPREVIADAKYEQRAHETLAAMGVLEEFNDHLCSFDARLSPQLLESLSAPLVYALRLLPGVLSNQPVLVLHHVGLKSMDEVEAGRILGALSNHVALIIADKCGEDFASLFSHVILVEAESVVGLGSPSWYGETHHSSLSKKDEIATEEAEEVPEDDLLDLDDE